ncbi:uncharacterized protein [Amphiura filiformis]|uniref:uncharacterized protein isoform X2 n=1 Tax=Amphiura filiformis TaxID=82378 RepID=UPI003B21737E
MSETSESSSKEDDTSDGLDSLSTCSKPNTATNVNTEMEPSSKEDATKDAATDALESTLLNAATIAGEPTSREETFRDGSSSLDSMLNAATYLSLDSPDVNTMRQDRRDRTRAAMLALDPALTKSVLPKSHNLSIEEQAAICIQCHFRGYLGRQRYIQLLYEQFAQEEEMRRLRTLRQCEEGELLIENHKLEIEFEDNHCIRRNRSQRFLSNVITIQRAWRKYKKSQTNNWRPETTTLTARDFNDRRDNQGDGDDPEPTDNNGNSQQSKKSDSFDVTERNRTLEEQRNLNVNQKGTNNSDVELCLWKLDNTNDNMASPPKSNKKNLPIFQDLGSSVELDDKDAFEESPDIGDIPTDKNVNRLSLAEEFAAMTDGAMGVSLDCDDTESELDSEFDIGSSSATTPDWDVVPKNDKIPPPHIVSQEDQEINEKTNSLTRGVKPGAMQDERNRLSISDANENYNDPNANSVSMDSESDIEPGTLQQHNSDNDTLTDNECESVNARNNKEDLIRTSSFDPSERLSHSHVESPHRTAEAAMDSPNDEDKTLSITDESPTEELGQSATVSTIRHDSMEKTTNSNVVTKKTNASAELAGLETTMPVLDWESLEKHLAKMEQEEEEQNLKQSQKNSRQAILKKLAMGTDDEAEGDIYGKGKDTLSRRLQSGMNLQICFVNEPLEGSGSDIEDDGHQAKEYHGSYHHSGFNSAGVRSSKSTGALSRECSNNSTSSGSSQKTIPSVTFEDEEDFDAKQARLQEEARIALARAEPLARMQMELERQQRKKSPVTELAGVTGLRDITISLGCRKFTRRALRNMSISKLQFIVNDLHSQIESLNEELVKVLIVRDELHMEQDSKLIDIEDLTRHAAEQQQLFNQQTTTGKRP